MATEDLARREWVLLPGTLCTGQVFDGFLDQLGVAEERRHVIDLSASSVDDYAMLPEVSRDAVVCGFSLGAIVAGHWADRLEAARLILFGINPLADDPEKAPGRKAMMEDVITSGARAALAQRLPDFAGSEPALVRERVLTMAESACPQIEAQTTLALTRPGALAALGKARCPVFVLTGAEDGMAPPTLGQQAAAAAPRAQFHLLPGLGHYALLEDAAACADAVAQMEARHDEQS